MSLHLKPENEVTLELLAAARGVSADDYIEASVERELIMETSGPSSRETATGMVEQNGLRVYGTGRPLPESFVDDTLRRSRQERSLHLLGQTP